MDRRMLGFRAERVPCQGGAGYVSSKQSGSGCMAPGPSTSHSRRHTVAEVRRTGMLARAGALLALAGEKRAG
jgi:hypothetical protein